MSKIAVLIPVFNQAEDLLRTLQSLDNQKADFDIFVIDDGSDPPIELPTARFRHPIHLIALETNRGCTVARNTGLAHIIRGGFDYVALQDAGDTDIGERVAIQADFLDRHPDIAVVGAWAEYVDRSGELLYVYQAPTTTGEIRARMPYVSAFANPASMIRLDALEQVGFYDPAYPIASDYEIFFRLTRAFETANLQQILIRKEDHPDSLSLGSRRKSLWYRLRAQIQHFSLPSIHSYLGVLSTLLLMLVPYRLVLSIKRWRGYAQ
jgi:glycosyltransferase involved in cell wall biosynthesis